MTEELSKSQIDRLGERLKAGSRTEEDLTLLDTYRQSFGEAYETVFGLLKRKAGLEPTGRVAKSTDSIIAKLRRQSTRLTRMQDIAGCRVVVLDVLAQEGLVLREWLDSLFSEAVVIDRRVNPRYGYRAIHVIVKIGGKPIEIQIRSQLQHLWAEMSEKFSDVLDPSIKYGGGDEAVQSFLAVESRMISIVEEGEKGLLTTQFLLKDPELRSHDPELQPNELEPVLSQAWEELKHLKKLIAGILEKMGVWVSELENQKNPSRARVTVSRVLDKLKDNIPELNKALSQFENGMSELNVIIHKLESSKRQGQ